MKYILIAVVLLLDYETNNSCDRNVNSFVRCNSRTIPPNPPLPRGGTAQAQPTAQQVLAAGVENKAETFTDVSPDHWAFKAVMTMYYCGAFRQATPPALIQRLTNVRNQDNPQSEN
ncbi:hypothetical protein [Microseira wollei]|uniref:S-layer region-like protein n=1 Tax=Microseira wollei NIES-4236 TaxID=2530354 RepID=A0AAV3XIR6_9CYAN|nr:hypothetical protein [Microseira wollei]GET40045.1 hypothetical protein MiSe_48530 [Microseira wollei NIES-4236]